MSPEDLSLVEAAAAIRAGELSPVQYVLSLFTRMSQVELRVQAWTTVDHENVLAEARKCETEAAKKQFRGPLHGVPVGIKDDSGAWTGRLERVKNNVALLTVRGTPQERGAAHGKMLEPEVVRLVASVKKYLL